jgi:hypothetical protein
VPHAMFESSDFSPQSTGKDKNKIQLVASEAIPDSIPITITETLLHIPDYSLYSAPCIFSFT